MDKGMAVENVQRRIDKRMKPESKKDKKKVESTMGVQEAQIIGTTKAMGSVRMSEKEDIVEKKKDDKVWKKNKKTKAAKIKKVSIEGEVADVYGENCSGDTMDDAERKRKNREKNKNKNGKFQANTEEVEGNENTKQLGEEGVSRKKRSKESNKDRKEQKVLTNHEDGDIPEKEKDRQMIGNDKVDATDMVERKKKKKDKKKSNVDDLIGPQDTYRESKHDKGDLSSLQLENMLDNLRVDVHSTKGGGNTTNEPRGKKKKHKKKENCEYELSAARQDSEDNGSNGLDKMQNNEAEYDSKRKKKKTKNSSDDGQDTEVEFANQGKKRKTVSTENGPTDATPNKSNKKVRFSGKDEVFPLPGDSNIEKGNGEEDNLVKGKRFTHEEDEIVKESVLKYIQEHDLGDEGLDMILNCSKHPEVKGCWKDIATAIPYRPYISIYCRARVLFMRSKSRKWTQEEYDMILKYQKEHGNQWKPLADELGKHTWHVKDTWRRIKLPNLKRGHWSQEEYQKLFDLVNIDLQMKVSEEKKSKHGMLRDNICWSAISDELSTRTQATCCLKWYKQMTSPMVAEGVWEDSDDYRLLNTLYSLDATCPEDVEWDDLVDNRSGDVCRKRWNQMVLHIGHHGKKSFAEQVEVLAQRYCPNLLEARVAWDSKPRVP